MSIADEQREPTEEEVKSAEKRLIDILTYFIKRYNISREELSKFKTSTQGYYLYGDPPRITDFRVLTEDDFSSFRLSVMQFFDLENHERFFK